MMPLVDELTRRRLARLLTSLEGELAQLEERQTDGVTQCRERLRGFRDDIRSVLARAERSS